MSDRMRERSRLARTRIALISVVVTVVLAVLAVGCGGSSDGDSASAGDEFVQVVDTEATYTLADLEAIGYRVSKTYDVDGLTDATGAYYGFWRPGSNDDPNDYEVRIYATHAVAVTSGTAQAEEATGDDAVLDKTISSWPEGLTDRRRVVGRGASQAIGQPRYPVYVIVGNLVVLCEGINLGHAREQCEAMVAALP